MFRPLSAAPGFEAGVEEMGDVGWDVRSSASTRKQRDRYVVETFGAAHAAERFS